MTLTMRSLKKIKSQLNLKDQNTVSAVISDHQKVFKIFLRKKKKKYMLELKCEMALKSSVST